MRTDNSTPLFINFSNHPSSNWEEKQFKAAEQYGKIIDLPFPQVNPLLTGEEIRALAKECVKEILGKGNPANLTVHVMGEMTLVYHIVTTLLKSGVRCVASTTQRFVIETAGKKESEFHFVRFREY